MTKNHEQFFVQYYPEVAQSLGNQNAATIMARMEYWFSKYADGFYKFLEPCEHPCYRSGDSWSEEIGIPRRVFNRAFDLIGVRYKSKTDFLKESDPFKGKPYASYHNRKSNRTHFVRNIRFLSDFFKTILAFFKPQSSLRGEGAINGRSRNDHYGHSYASANKDKQINTSSSKFKGQDKDPQEPSFEMIEKIKVEEEMIQIWKEEVGEVGNHNPQKLSKQLLEVFILEFKGCLKAWKSYCQLIAQSDFLMGRVKNQTQEHDFKGVWLTWAVQPQIIKRIQGLEFHKKPSGTGEISNETAQSMINTWQEIIGPLEELDKKAFAQKQLSKTLATSFGNTLDKWRDYCTQIASSKFLMGEEKKAKTFKKARLLWAAHPETIEKVRGGAFTLGDRKVEVIQKAYTQEIESQSEKLIDEIIFRNQLGEGASDLLKALNASGQSGEFFNTFKDLKSYEIFVDLENKTFSIQTKNGFTHFMIDRYVRQNVLGAGIKIESGKTFKVTVEC